MIIVYEKLTVDVVAIAITRQTETLGNVRMYDVGTDQQGATLVRCSHVTF